MEFSRQKPPPKEMNLLPVINLIFLLLIFFMVAGTIDKIDIIPVDLPVADSGKVLDEGKIVIVLGLHDDVLLNDEFVSYEQLPRVLHEALKEDPERVISIKGDAMLPAERIITVMDVVRAAGGRNLSLVTQSLPGA
jgi:biopolymer transport protein ExbD